MNASATTESTPVKPRRSALFMPGSNPRVLAKARELAADCVIFDWEDAVAPDAKEQARRLVGEAIAAGGYGDRELVVRINALDTDWASVDIAQAARIGADAVLLPKVDAAADVHHLRAELARAGAADSLALWVMAETPRGILQLDAIVASDPHLRVVVVGTEDLTKAMRVPPQPSREGLLAALQHCVIVARAHGLDVLDGVYTDVTDGPGFERQCRHGRSLGYDGKTLVHPRQIAVANEVFGVSGEQAEHARRIVAAWEEARTRGEGVTVVDGHMVEQLHVDIARRVLRLHQATRPG